MLDLFRRKNLTSLIFGALTVALSAGLVVTLNQGGSGGKNISLKEAVSQECVVKVGAHSCVSPKEFLAVIRVVKPLEDDEQFEHRFNLRSLVADKLVEREVLIQEAMKLGLAVTEDEVQDMLFSGFMRSSIPDDITRQFAGNEAFEDGRINFPLFRRNKKGDARQIEKQYENYAKGYLGSRQAFEAWQAKELLASKVRDLIRAPVRVSEEEALQSFLVENTTVNVEYIEVSEAFVAKYIPPLTDASLSQWLRDEAHSKEVDKTFEEQKEDDTPKEGQIRHILIKTSEGASEIDQAKARSRLGMAWSRLRSGENFSDVARDLSDDPGSARRGGYYAAKDLEGFVEEFKTKAAELSPGQMSDGAIETQFGWHILMKDDPSTKDLVLGRAKHDIAKRLYFRQQVGEKTKEVALKMGAALREKKSPDEAIRYGLSILLHTAFKYPEVKILKRHVSRSESQLGDAGAGDAGVLNAIPSNADAGKKVDMRSGGRSMADLTVETDLDRPYLQTSLAFSRAGTAISSIDAQNTAKLNEFAFGGNEGDVIGEPLRSTGMGASLGYEPVSKKGPGYMTVRIKSKKVATKEEFEKERETFVQGKLSMKQKDILSSYVTALKETYSAQTKIDRKYTQKSAGDAGAASSFQDDEP